MTSNEILHATFLDLLFENRNKDYGAYTLRKFYNQRLLIALSVSVVVAALLVLPFTLLLRNKPAIFDNPLPDVELRTVAIPLEPKPPVPATPAPPQQASKPVAQQQYTQIHITSAPLQMTDVPAQTDLATVAISNQTVESTAVPAVSTPALSQAGTGSDFIEKPAAAPVDAEPQFPGGSAAWAAFLSRHLQAPGPLEAGEKITVLVRFLVDVGGAVTSFEILKSGGEPFDTEVLRVLRKMPKWKPALHNGQPTAVPFTQPVTFIAQD